MTLSYRTPVLVFMDITTSFLTLRVEMEVLEETVLRFPLQSLISSRLLFLVCLVCFGGKNSFSLLIIPGDHR